MARVVRAAETAKKQLSDHPFARIQEEYLAGRDGNPVNLDLELSRNDYEEMIAPFIEETLGAIHIALESASLTASQVDEILLVGGATRTPMIRRRLIEAFGKEPRGEVVNLSLSRDNRSRSCITSSFSSSNSSTRIGSSLSEVSNLGDSIGQLGEVDH